MLKLVLPISLAVALAPSAVLAQSTTATSDSHKSSSQSTQNLPQQIQSKLQDQGFTNVQVVPGSFLVSAKDKQGDPVTMIIGPRSMSVFTMNTSDGSSTVGSSDQSKKSGSK
jgi:hypothetical protein